MVREWWGVSKRGSEKQIPFGDDNKKGKSKNKGEAGVGQPAVMRGWRTSRSFDALRLLRLTLSENSREFRGVRGYPTHRKGEMDGAPGYLLSHSFGKSGRMNGAPTSGIEAGRLVSPRSQKRDRGHPERMDEWVRGGR